LLVTSDYLDSDYSFNFLIVGALYELAKFDIGMLVKSRKDLRLP